MKRKEFLAISGCSVKKFDNMNLRKDGPRLPRTSSKLSDPEGKHADYSMLDAFVLRIFLNASENKGLSLEAAKYISGDCVRQLKLATARATSLDTDMWVFYAQGFMQQFEDTGEYWTPRQLGAGSLEDLAQFVEEKTMPHETQFIAMVNATAVSDIVLLEAIRRSVLAVDDRPMKQLWEQDYPTVSTDIED